MNSALEPSRTMRPPVKRRALELAVIATIFAQQMTARGVARASTGMDSDDRGEVLAWVTVAVGMAVIAALLLTQIRGKGETIVQNICTNADPTTC